MSPSLAYVSRVLTVLVAVYLDSKAPDERTEVERQRAERDAQTRGEEDELAI